MFTILLAWNTTSGLKWLAIKSPIPPLPSLALVLQMFTTTGILFDIGPKY